MSSSDSETDISLSSEMSEYECECETLNPKRSIQSSHSECESEYGYQDEPLADEQWVAEYEERERATEELELELNKRLKEEIPVVKWCKCGNCGTSRIQISVNECYCCIIRWLCGGLDNRPRNARSITWSFSCLRDPAPWISTCLPPEMEPKDGSRQISNKKKNKQRYRQTGAEERFLRSTAQREFSRLIYGMLGSRRIPLPACAYMACNSQRRKLHWF